MRPNRSIIGMTCVAMSVAVSVSLSVFATSASAAIINVDIDGKAGVGLLPGNENHVVNTGGTGGETGAGITFDDVSKQLTLNFGWGSGNGFTDLSVNASAGHIHGITAGGAPASFLQNAGVTLGLDNLGGWNPSRTNGGFNGTVTLNAAQEAGLLSGSLYLNIHTAGVNPAGEIRGNLVIPEPTTMLAIASMGGLILRRRRA